MLYFVAINSMMGYRTTYPNARRTERIVRNPDSGWGGGQWEWDRHPINQKGSGNFTQRSYCIFVTGV